MSTTEPVDALETADAYPKYDEYEESGVKWLGEIPAHWDVERLKWTVTDCKNGYWGGSPEGDESDINTVRVADFDRFALRVPDQDFTVRSVPPEKRKGRVLGKGDLLLEKSGGGDKQPVGVVMLYDLDQPAVCSNFIARMPVADGHDPSFLRYLHGALYEAGLNERAIKQSIGIQNLDADQYLNQEVGLPPLGEQHAIAAFLDHETKRIDALIEKKEELIDLLEEKRTALISRVVTKGLDEDVEMQDSGVEWLGEIPAHWDVERLKWTVTDCKNGYWGDSPEGDESDINTVRVADFDRFALRVPYQDFTVRSVPSEKRDGRVLEKGNLLLEKSGGGDKQPVGVVVLYDLDQPAVCSNFIARMPVANGYEPSFLRYLHGALYEAGLNVPAIKQSIGIQNLDADYYLNQKVGLPPLSEQSTIASFLDRETDHVDELVQRITRAIDRLEEYRTALISAAVTGQIDVREEVPESPAE